eukprot:c25396_g1_i1 orf=282-1286(+)
MSNSDRDDSEDEEAWIPFSERAEWADVQPVPQDDGPNPVVPIAYTKQFREAMDYFRAILMRDERSERALQLTEEVIKLNAGNYTVWHFRRLILEALSIDLFEELSFIERVSEPNYKNYQIWHHRRWAAQKLGPASVPYELQFTEKVLSDDAKNYHAWSHRQYIIRSLGGWESELDYCSRLLEEDIYNNSAWNQRYFVITNSPLLGGLHSMRDAEVDYCLEAIRKAPSNESPWRYLRGLYKGDNEAFLKSKAVTEVCLRELSKDCNCVFALDLLLDLICLGLKPPSHLFALFGLDESSCTLAKLGHFLCSHLKEVDAIRARYWDWRQSTLLLTDN